MQKRGQVTIFIVLGVLLLVTILSLFSLKYFLRTEGNPAHADFPGSIVLFKSPLTSFISNCFEDSLKNGILYVALRGGYFTPPADYTLVDSNEVPYYYLESKNLTPSPGFIEEELKHFITTTLDICLGDFETFKKQGYSFELGDRTITVDIKKNQVEATLHLQGQFIRGIYVFELDPFSIRVKSKFNQIYDFARGIVTSQLHNKKKLPLTDIFLHQNLLGVETEVDAIADDTILFTIVDYEDTVRGFPLIYRFAAKYAPDPTRSLPKNKSEVT